MLRFVLGLTTALVGLFHLFGCEGKHDVGGGIAAPEIPFRGDGILVFYRNELPLDSLQIEIADTDSARTRGLMQRSNIPPRSGMLFIFEEEEMQSFWMANTQMSLDIFFITSDREIANIARYTRPLSPDQVRSDGPARYVLETPAGYADSRGITESDRVEWWRVEA